MRVTRSQKISAGEELLTAVRLVSSGLGQLRLLADGTSDFFHLPILALQTGFERWFKISLCFHYLEQHGHFPKSNLFPRNRAGHDIEPFRKRLLAVYSPEVETAFPYLRQDRMFLSSRQLKRYTAFLSTFGQSSRYYHLNVVLGETPSYYSPETVWQDLEGEILKDDPALEKQFWDKDGAPEVLDIVLRKSRAIMIRCARALARLLVLGVLGIEARRLTGYVLCFSSLSDDDLETVEFDAFNKLV